MKLFLILLLTAPLLLGSQLSAQITKEAPQTAHNKETVTAAWIEFHQQTLALKQAYRSRKKKNNKQAKTAFYEIAQKVDLALNALVAQKELVSSNFKFTPAKLSKEQADLLQYCFNTASQIYGDSAALDMFDMGYKKRQEIVRDPAEQNLNTRLPKKLHDMFKQIFANDQLEKIKLPRPVVLAEITESKDLWTFFYKNIDLADAVAQTIKQNKSANPLKAADALMSLNKVLKKMVENKLLQTKTYPFKYEKMSLIQIEQLHLLMTVENRFGDLARNEMLGIGNTKVLNEALLPAVKAGNFKMNLDDLNQNLTLYLPSGEFQKVSQFLDAIGMPQAKPQLSPSPQQ